MAFKRPDLVTSKLELMSRRETVGVTEIDSRKVKRFWTDREARWASRASWLEYLVSVRFQALHKMRRTEGGIYASTVKTVFPSPVTGAKMAYWVMLGLAMVIFEMSFKWAPSWAVC